MSVFIQQMIRDTPKAGSHLKVAYLGFMFQGIPTVIGVPNEEVVQTIMYLEDSGHGPVTPLIERSQILAVEAYAHSQKKTEVLV